MLSCKKLITCCVCVQYNYIYHFIGLTFWQYTFDIIDSIMDFFMAPWPLDHIANLKLCQCVSLFSYFKISLLLFHSSKVASDFTSCSSSFSSSSSLSFLFSTLSNAWLLSLLVSTVSVAAFSSSEALLLVRISCPVRKCSPIWKGHPSKENLN